MIISIINNRAINNELFCSFLDDRSGSCQERGGGPPPTHLQRLGRLTPHASGRTVPPRAVFALYGLEERAAGSNDKANRSAPRPKRDAESRRPWRGRDDQQSAPHSRTDRQRPEYVEGTRSMD